jgi:hypothetical protein
MNRVSPSSRASHFSIHLEMKAGADAEQKVTDWKPRPVGIRDRITDLIAS